MTGNRRLAVLAAFLASAALLAGSPYPRVADVDTLARMVEAEEDHVSALELAAWIRDRKSGLRVIDVRDADAFADYAIPRAENVPVDELVRLPFRRNETVVLYSEGGAHAAQAWVLLRARGVRNVYQLKGGLYAWVDEVMNASVPSNASPETIRRFQEEVAPLARYFGGLPRVGGPVDDPAALEVPGGVQRTGSAVRELRRRGC